MLCCSHVQLSLFGEEQTGLEKVVEIERLLLYPLVSMCTVIGQFSGLYSPLLSCWFCCRLFCDIYRQMFLPFTANKSSKLSFTLNCVLNDFKLISFALEVRQTFEAVPHE